MIELLGKKLTDIDIPFIKLLIDSRIPENYQLEYKGQDFLFKDLIDSAPKAYEKHQLDLIQIMCGFANTHGGFIIFGIKEKLVDKDHLPDSIEGAEIANFDILITSLVHKGVQPRLLHKQRKIENPFDSMKPIFVLEVEESPVPVMMYWRDKP